jgi:hypothetical protein
VAVAVAAVATVAVFCPECIPFLVEAAEETEVVEETTTLFRVVGPEELESIEEAGAYTQSPGGLEVKYFYPTAEQGSTFAANPANAQFGPFTLTSVEVPTSLLSSPGVSIIAPAGEGTAITIPIELLPDLGEPTIFDWLPLP